MSQRDLRDAKRSLPKSRRKPAAKATRPSSDTSSSKSVGPKKILAVDGNSLIYRAYFGLPDSIRDPSGRPVNAVYGFVSMLVRLLRDHRPTGLVVAYDSAWPTLRHKAFPDYKAKRQALPSDLLNQVPIVKALLARMGACGLAVSGYEGDDILAALASKCLEEGTSLLLVTGDRDLFQLVRDPLIRVLYTKRGVSSQQILDETGVRDLVGVPPSRYADLAALRGDTSDNIKGIAGIGTVTAIRLIQAAPTLEELYGRLDSLPNRTAELLRSSKPSLHRNRDLMRLISNVPIDWDQLNLSSQLEPSLAREEFQKLGFDKLYATVSRFLKPEGTSPKDLDGSVATSPSTLPSGNRVSLVACCADKLPKAAPAADLYISPLFKKSRAWAELSSKDWFIISGLHGLVDPAAKLRPYDVSLKDLPSAKRERWKMKVLAQIDRTFAPGDSLVFLTGQTYAEPLLDDLKERQYRVALPLNRMSIGERLHWLDSHLSLGSVAADLEVFYEILTWLGTQIGGLRKITDDHLKEWPDRGVYFFFEPTETRLCSDQPRVVRVGTHAVSANSKATLWNRLRTHRGVAEGAGNHRSSIFRSHIGTALLHRDNRTAAFPHWGDQSIDSPRVKDTEIELERLVSSVLASMSVLYVEVPDEPGPRSDRAYIERNAIALLSRVGRLLDRQSQEWLGKWSPHESIRSSGLWNINHVDESAWDPKFLEVFDYYARATARRTVFRLGSVAPQGWWDRSVSHDQLRFDWAETPRPPARLGKQSDP